MVTPAGQASARQERCRLLADPRRLAVEAELLDVLPAALAARAAVRARIAAVLNAAVVRDRQRVDPAAALDEALRESAPSEERKTRSSRSARTDASVIFTSGRRMPSSARRQSAIFSFSGTSTGSRSDEAE